MKEQIKKAKKGSFLGVSGSLDILEKQIHESETPLIIVQGMFDDKNGILAATTKRAIVISKLLFSSTIKDIPYQKITGVSLESGLINSDIKIEYSGGNIKVKSIDKEAAKAMVSILNSKINEKPEGEIQKTNKEDVFDKLTKLGALRDSGILTEEEFVNQKNKLLSDM